MSRLHWFQQFPESGLRSSPFAATDIPAFRGAASRQSGTSHDGAPPLPRGLRQQGQQARDASADAALIAALWLARRRNRETVGERFGVFAPTIAAGTIGGTAPEIVGQWFGPSDWTIARWTIRENVGGSTRGNAPASCQRFGGEFARKFFRTFANRFGREWFGKVPPADRREVRQGGQGQAGRQEPPDLGRRGFRSKIPEMAGGDRPEVSQRARVRPR